VLKNPLAASRLFSAFTGLYGSGVGDLLTASPNLSCDTFCFSSFGLSSNLFFASLS
jgi:hypothetical protein